MAHFLEILSLEENNKIQPRFVIRGKGKSTYDGSGESSSLIPVIIDSMLIFPDLQELEYHCSQWIHSYIILINNRGYTTKRVIHGPEQKYNDISES